MTGDGSTAGHYSTTDKNSDRAMCIHRHTSIGTPSGDAIGEPLGATDASKLKCSQNVCQARTGASHTCNPPFHTPRSPHRAMGTELIESHWQSHVCIHAQLLQSCLTLWDPMECSPPGSSVHGISQARILEWVAMPSSRGSSQPRDRTHISCSSCIAGGFFTAKSPGKPNWQSQQPFLGC